METHVDRISKLPTCITDNILSKLSIRDAARTSILSSQWRNKWTTFPRLVFDHHLPALLPSHRTFTEENLLNIIDLVLHLHNGLIHTFRVSLHSLPGSHRIGRWINILSRKESLNEFVLKICCGDKYYRVSSSLYYCQKLIHLELLNCALSKPPSIFTGFTSLKTLDLQNITMAEDACECFTSKCPLLEKLRLKNFKGFTRLNIDAPNLLCLDIEGVFEEVSLENTFQLAEVYTTLNYMIDNINKNGVYDIKDRGDTMVKFFSSLPCLHRLKVGGHFLKYLTTGSNVPNKLSNPCTNLRYLCLYIDFEVREEYNAAVCLVNSSPNLKELNILARPCLRVKVDNGTYYKDCEPFTNLQLIKIGGTILGRASVVNLIKLLLSNSPVLEKIVIELANYEVGYKILKELINFRQRYSVVAKIVIVGP